MSKEKTKKILLSKWSWGSERGYYGSKIKTTYIINYEKSFKHSNCLFLSIVWEKIRIW